MTEQEELKMSFWSGETLEQRLPHLIHPVGAFDVGRIDCAAYTLTVGNEFFATADLPEVGSASDGVKRFLKPGEQVKINPGQFGFLVSQETIEVPNTAIAFISMKATYKVRGLINVSGFHVDPGWKAPLLFAVYNAGPSPVCISQGMPLFLIWYSSLDRPTSRTYTGKGKSIDADLISNMSGEVFSPIALKKEVNRLRDELRDAANDVVKVSGAVSTVSTFAFRFGIGVAALLAGAIGYLFSALTDARIELGSMRGAVSAMQRDEVRRTSTGPMDSQNPKMRPGPSKGAKEANSP
jgi:dCTP deaminase